MGTAAPLLDVDSPAPGADGARADGARADGALAADTAPPLPSGAELVTLD